MMQKKDGSWLVKRNLHAFQALQGVLKGKKIIDPVKWQRKIREDRALP